MASVREIFEAHRALFGTVPPAGSSFVCAQCLGPVSAGFTECYACDRVFGAHPFTEGRKHIVIWTPRELDRRVVPMTSALSPSPWYTRLLTYKQGQPEYGGALGALAYVYLEANREPLEQLLGGPATILTIVPSKRGPVFDDQPFRKALALVPPLAERLAHTLTHVVGAKVERWQYNPAAFAAGPVPVRAQRVLLLDDTWVTGATAVSAAGALLREGATGVVILPLARMVDSGFWPEEHLYRQAMKAPYDPAASVR